MNTVEPIEIDKVVADVEFVAGGLDVSFC